MIRTLFVDDEVDVLEGLENRLRRLRRSWKMSFAVGGEAALKELEKDPYDVIVSDMRMPGIDGAALLEQVAGRFPQMVRIILSGQTEHEQILRALPVAHQFLSKPCDAAVLEQAVERACSLRTLLADEQVQELVSGTNRLPALPRLYVELGEVVNKPDTSLADAAAVVAQDVAMTARILQIVNSSFFGMGRNVVDVKDAISYLGLNALRAVVLTVSLFEALDEGSIRVGFSLERLQEHSLRTATLAARLVPSVERAQTAFSSGMLHGIGDLLLSGSRPDFYARALERAEETGLALHCAEQEVHGFTHAEVGAALLALWGIPYPIVEAVAYHHRPSTSLEAEFGVVGAVHVADCLAHELESEGAETHEKKAPLDEAYLRKVSVWDKVESWRDLARGVQER